MASTAVTRISRPPRTFARVRIRRERSQQASIELREVLPGSVARDLDDLVAMGFLEAFRDEHNVLRYRPLKGAVRHDFAA
jgi:hypothetical protein